MVNWYKIAKYKLAASNAESLREFNSWYQNRWKTSYPDLYRNRYNNSYRPKRVRRTTYKPYRRYRRR